MGENEVFDEEAIAVAPLNVEKCRGEAIPRVPDEGERVEFFPLFGEHHLELCSGGVSKYWMFSCDRSQDLFDRSSTCAGNVNEKCLKLS